jgi:hypothetical protein
MQDRQPRVRPVSLLGAAAAPAPIISRKVNQINILSAIQGSPTLPRKTDGDVEEFYRRAAQLRIAIYKTVIDPHELSEEIGDGS